MIDQLFVFAMRTHKTSNENKPTAPRQSFPTVYNYPLRETFTNSPRRSLFAKVEGRRTILYFARLTFTGYEIASAPEINTNYIAIPGASQ